MRSLPKYFIMWICKALSGATPSCSSSTSFLIHGSNNVKKICVQKFSRQSMLSSFIVSFDDQIPKVQVLPKFLFFSPFSTKTKMMMMTRTTTNNKGTTNGHLMLNVQFSRPFHTLSYFSTSFDNQNQVCRQNLWTVQARRFLSTLPEPSVKGVCEPTVVQKLNNNNYDDESDEDTEELKKEAIWNVGPTPAASFTFAAYANDSVIVKKLVQLGVNLSRVEKKYGAIPFLLKLDYEKNIEPIVRFLCDNGVDQEILGWYLTKNPFIINEDVKNLEKRLDYLRIKQFTQENIERIINANPYWLSFSITRIDQRLGFFQSFFRLTGNQVRELSVSGPKLITSKLSRVKDVTFTVKEEMGFEPHEIVKMLLVKPRIWREAPKVIFGRFDYLHNTVKFPHDAFVLCPQLLMVRESRLKQRIGFLEKVGKAQFDPEKPNYVSFQMIYEGDDSTFSTKVAKSSVLEFNDYMKCL